MSIVDLLRVLFPHLAGLRITNVLASGSTVRIHAETCTVAVACPVCATPSRRVHSRYERRLLDAAVAGRETLLHLRVRRFVCATVDCVRKIFVEQVEGLTARHGRVSQLGRRLLEPIALALGGRAGGRLTDRLGLAVGRMTLLRLVRALPLPVISALTVLGVDDFALRRGHRYGTVLVDMLTHQIIDVLDDRSADSLAAWLEQHPGIEVICRDRAGCYAEGAQRGAPTAVQVADRWHLLHNLSEAVNKAVAAHRRCLRPTTAEQQDPVDEPQQPAEPPEPPTSPAEQPEGHLAQRTRARHADVHALRAQGLGFHVIARKLGLDPKTVHRYADTPDVETLLGPRGTNRDSVLDAFKPYLRQRCADGVTGTNQLLAEVQQRGYRGGERTLRRWLVSYRGTPTAPAAETPVPTARDITGWIMRPIPKLTDDDRAELARICQLCPDLAAIRDLARGFAHILRTRTGEQLKTWVEQADQSTITEIRSFANGLRKDWAAVMAGLTQPWSSGQVEGNVNRIKMIKRQMFGRAKTDLLRRRVLLDH